MCFGRGRKRLLACGEFRRFGLGAKVLWMQLGLRNAGRQEEGSGGGRWVRRDGRGERLRASDLRSARWGPVGWSCCGRVGVGRDWVVTGVRRGGKGVGRLVGSGGGVGGL